MTHSTIASLPDTETLHGLQVIDAGAVLGMGGTTTTIIAADSQSIGTELLLAAL